jgi:hypothetical protein
MTPSANYLRRRILCLLLLAFCAVIVPPAAPAQDKDKDKEKEAEQRRELEKKTLALLNDIASASWGLKLPENRVFVMGTAADMLWQFDEKRARALYWDALNAVNFINPARNSNENLSKAEREKIVQAYFATYNLRVRLLRQVARRDAQLALDMLRATRQVAPRRAEGEFAFPDDRQIEQEIASEVAARDPAQALQLARQSLAKGLTFELLNLLDQLRQKDPEKAAQFAGEVVAKIQTTNVANDMRASILGVQLLHSSRPVDENQRGRLSSNGNGPGVLRLSEEQRRTLVDVLTNAALTTSANSSLLYRVMELMPEIEQFFPERRAPLERKLATFNQTLPKEEREQLKYSDMIRAGKAEDLVRSAAATDDATRGMLYRQAAIIALSEGRSDSFRDFVSKEVSDSGERRKLFDYMDVEEIGMTAGRKQVDQLRKLVPKIERKEERGWAMVELALLLKEKGEDEEAASVLDDAASLIKMDLKDDRKTNALLALLSAYAIIDPPKAFALAERTVDQANSDISLLLLVDRVVKTGAVKNGEIILDQGQLLPLDFLVFKYGKSVAALAKTDFGRTKALADRFDRNELRLMAQLMIVRGILLPQNPSPANLQLIINH